jgi:hypothetical protein
MRFVPAVIAACLAFTPGAWADQINFSSSFPESGNLSYGGDGTPLVGSGLAIGGISYQDANSNIIWSRTLFGGTIDFETGGARPGGGENAISFGLGGAFTISGSIDAQSPAQVLFEGTFTGFAPLILVVNGSNYFFSGTGVGHYTQAMLDAYSEIVGQPGNELIGQDYTFALGGSFNASPIRNGFSVTPDGMGASAGAARTVPLPEPSAVVLLGIGSAVGLGAWKRSAYRRP